MGEVCLKSLSQYFIENDAVRNDEMSKCECVASFFSQVNIVNTGLGVR